MIRSVVRDKLRFMLITDRHAARRPLMEVVDSALRAGFTCVQLREKDLGAEELYHLALPLREITRSHGALFLVNDRVDVALAADADGVHLGWRSLNPAVTRNLVNGQDNFIIGASTHNIVEVRNALKAHVDYVSFGPVYPTPSKSGLVSAVGLDQLRKMSVPSPVPIVAVGGITAGNIGEIFHARATGAAVIRAVMAAGDPYSESRRIIQSVPQKPLPAPADQVVLH